MSAAVAFKCPLTGEIVRPSGGRCPSCGADRMRGHLRLVDREWVLNQEGGQDLPQVENTSPVVEFQPTGRAKRQVVTPELLRRYRAAREWLLPREPELLTTGWTRAGLYRLRHPLGSTYGWGISWSTWWIEPNVTPCMGAAGHIEFHVSEYDGRVNMLVARPR